MAVERVEYGLLRLAADVVLGLVGGAVRVTAGWFPTEEPVPDGLLAVVDRMREFAPEFKDFAQN